MKQKELKQASTETKQERRNLSLSQLFRRLNGLEQYDPQSCFKSLVSFTLADRRGHAYGRTHGFAWVRYSTQQLENVDNVQDVHLEIIRQKLTKSEYDSDIRFIENARYRCIEEDYYAPTIQQEYGFYINGCVPDNIPLPDTTPDGVATAESLFIYPDYTRNTALVSYSLQDGVHGFMWVRFSDDENLASRKLKVRKFWAKTIEVKLKEYFGDVPFTFKYNLLYQLKERERNAPIFQSHFEFQCLNCGERVY